MKTKSPKTPAAALLAALLAAPAANAALVSRAGGTMVYDDVANLTWVADANLFKTQAAADASLVSQILASPSATVHDTPNTNDTPANSGTHLVDYIEKHEEKHGNA